MNLSTGRRRGGNDEADQAGPIIRKVTLRQIAILNYVNPF
jgi:hypothetical protein